MENKTVVIATLWLLYGYFMGNLWVIYGRRIKSYSQFLMYGYEKQKEFVTKVKYLTGRLGVSKNKMNAKKELKFGRKV